MRAFFSTPRQSTSHRIWSITKIQTLKAVRASMHTPTWSNQKLLKLTSQRFGSERFDIFMMWSIATMSSQEPVFLSLKYWTSILNASTSTALNTTTRDSSDKISKNHQECISYALNICISMLTSFGARGWMNLMKLKVSHGAETPCRRAFSRNVPLSVISDLIELHYLWWEE